MPPTTEPIWIWPYDYPVGGKRDYDERIIPMPKGYSLGVIKGDAHSQADGIGGVTSQKGAMDFRIVVRYADYYSDQDFKDILSFLMAQKNAGNRRFDFYNMLENDALTTWVGKLTTPLVEGQTSGGTTVNNTIGCYSVRHIGPIPWQLTRRMQCDFNLTFEQTFRI